MTPRKVIPMSGLIAVSITPKKHAKCWLSRQCHSKESSTNLMQNFGIKQSAVEMNHLFSYKLVYTAENIYFSHTKKKKSGVKCFSPLPRYVNSYLFFLHLKYSNISFPFFKWKTINSVCCTCPCSVTQEV